MKLNEYLSETGRAAALAREICVHPVVVSQWKSGARPVPAERCPSIEKATGGIVRCEEMRPDIDWAYIRQQTN
jgi:DNA-binding transcriptional regulator YdaS (Cro superfamily)